MKKISLLIIISCLIINIFAYSLLEYQYGNYVQTPSARNRAMGSSGVAASYSLFDAALNPANTSFLSNKVNADFALAFTKNEEDRSLPMFNFFDSYIDNATYSNNENVYTEASAGLSYSYQMNQWNFSSALMFRPLVDFSAEYEEQVRNDADSDANTYPPIIAKNFKEGDGALNAYSVMLSSAYKFNKVQTLALGLELAMLKGSQNHESRIFWTEIAHETVGAGILPDSLYKSSRDIDGMMIKIGTTFNLNERLRLAFTYQPKAECDVEETINSVDTANPAKYIVPSSMRWGISYLPRNPFKTTFQMDMELNNYSDINKYLDNTISIFVGMEHYVGRAVPLRLGFKHECSMLDKTITMPTVSAGTAFPVAKNLVFNISGEFSTRTYETLDLFRDGYYNYANLWSSIEPQDRGWELPDKVKEQFFRIQTNLSYTW